MKIKTMKIIERRHSDYYTSALNWRKWRLVYEAGDNFITEYLAFYSNRESEPEYYARKQMTYCPAFAKAALDEVKNTIFGRMCDIRRIGGPLTYQQQINQNVDLKRNSLTGFLGGQVLPELLSMGSVGIFTDMPKLSGSTLLATQNARPYVYLYKVEDILDWSYGEDCEFTELLLRSRATHDTSITYYQHWHMEQGNVVLTVYDDEGEVVTRVETSLPHIPFTKLDLPSSLLSEVANYQIALLNMESSDINYIIRSNFPFYVEQYDARLEQTHHTHFSPDGDADDAGNQDTKEITVGVSQGRRYGKDLDAPQFIHPSAEPLKASMAKGVQLRSDIRALVNLAVDSLTDDGVRNGLAFIALVLEKAEKQIACYWSTYTNEPAAQIIYPEDFSNVTDETRINKANGLDTLKTKIVSATYQKEISKRVVDALLSGKLSQEMINQIYREIDTAPTLTSDPKIIYLDLEHGLVGNETASLARGYSADEVAKAQADRAERIRLTMLAQGGQGGQARGALDHQTVQPTSKDEKKGKLQRGEGRL